MAKSPEVAQGLAPADAAPQHKPRPLPLFLELLRSETAASPERMAAALKGLRAYQEAPRSPRPPAMPVAAEAGRARLLDYGGSGPPAVFVPSLINPPHILDLAEGNSLLRWLAGRGVRPYLVDWGNPDPPPSTAPGRGTARRSRVVEGQGHNRGVTSSRPDIAPPLHQPSAGPPPQAELGEDLDIAGHIETLLLPLLDALGEPAHLAGYCLGGTMAAAAAHSASPLSLTLIAAPWRFDGFPDEARDGLGELWEAAEPTARALGALPMEVLQAAFWKLDPTRTVAKFEKFGRLDPDSDNARAFVALEDWANDGPPLTYGAAQELIEEMFGVDATGEGRWQVAGEVIDPASLPCPVLDIVSSTDRIVPEASAARAGEVRTLALGHVGMVVGGRAKKNLWQPLAEWLSQVQHG